MCGRLKKSSLNKSPFVGRDFNREIERKLFFFFSSKWVVACRDCFEVVGESRVAVKGFRKLAFGERRVDRRRTNPGCTGASSSFPAVVPFGRFPTVCAGGVDLTSRFLQFGALENQCGQSYLAVPIAAAAAVAASVWVRFAPLPPLARLLRNCTTRSDERKSTACCTTLNVSFV